MDKFGRTTSTATLRVNNNDANAKIAATKKDADGIGTAFSKVPLLVSGISAVLPSAISLTGVLGAGAVAVAGGFASAGIAAGAFGAVALPMFKATAAAATKLKAAQAAEAKASTPTARLAALKAEKQALDALTPSELKLYGAVTQLGKAYTAQAKAIQPDVLRAVLPFLASADHALTLLPLAAIPAAGAIHQVGTQLEALVSSGTTQQFARFIGTEGSQSIGAGGSFLVNVIKTVMELLPQFSPLITRADDAVERWGNDLAKWGGSSGTGAGITNFITWAERNAPTVESFFDHLGAAIVNLGRAESAGGITELKVLSTILDGISHLPPDLLAPVVSGLTAIALLSKVSVGRGLLDGLGSLAGRSTGISNVASSLTGFAGATRDATLAERGMLAAEVALEAITPFGWAVAGTAAIGALGYVLLKNTQTTKGYTDALTQQYHATGYNVQGYRDLAKQLSDPSSVAGQHQLAAAITATGSSLRFAKDGESAYAQGQAQVSAAAEQARETAMQLGQQLSSVGAVFGLTQKQAIGAAEGANISSTAWLGNARSVALARKQFEQYIITNDHARGPQTETNALIAAMGSSSLTAAQRITAMDTTYRHLVGDLISRQQTTDQAKQQFNSVAAAIRSTGLASHESAQQIQEWSLNLPGLESRLGSAHGSLHKFIGAEQNHIDALLKMHGLTAGEIQDLKGTRKYLDALAESTQGLTGYQKAAANAIASQFLPQLSLTGSVSHGVRTDMDHLSDSIVKTGTQSDSSHAARQALIKDLENAGYSADNARKLVRNFIGELGKIPRHESTGISVTGTGRWSVTRSGLPGGGGHHVGAAGVFINAGQPGVDDQLVLAQRGELVVPTSLVSAGAVDHLRGQIPGFADGGVVGSYSGGVRGLGTWAKSQDAATLLAIEKSVAAATVAGIKAASPGPGGGGIGPLPGGGIGGGGAAGANQAIARALLPLYGWGQNQMSYLIPLWNQECLTLDVHILTRRGWLSHDQVRPDDQTIGYNPATGRSEWTTVTRVIRYEEAEVWRIGGSRWHADVTPEHRWWNDSRKNNGRGHIREHSGFKRTRDLARGDRLRLAAPADTEGIPGLSLEDVAVLAWMQGDGHIEPVLRSELTSCPECGWRPAPDAVNANRSVALHRFHPRVKHARTYQDEPVLSGYDGRIYQSKPEQVIRLRALLAHVDHTESIARRTGRPVGHRPEHAFLLRREYVTDLVKRSEVMETGPEKFVLRLSPDQRAAWLAAIIDAEGSAVGAYTMIWQNEGPLCDAIQLAVYLEGFRPNLRASRTVARTIGLGNPHVAVHRFGPPKILERQPVWCVTTELGTWTARQDDRVFLTGNSGWNQYADNPSSGAYGIPQSLPGDKMAAAGADWRTNPVTQERWGLGYIKGRYGSPAGAEAHELAYHWYDGGGWLPPGGSLAFNSTQRREAVLTPSQSEAFVAMGEEGGMTALAGLLGELIDAVHQNSGDTADGVAAALGGAGHRAAYRAQYSARS